MLIRIDAANERAIYAQIADSARSDIAAGKVRAGATLPRAKPADTLVGLTADERALVARACSLGVSQATVAALVVGLGQQGPPPSGSEPVTLQPAQEQAAA